MTDRAVPTFSMAERYRRWDLARAFMEREGLDALLVFGEHEDAGSAPFAYDTWLMNGRAGTTVVFPREGDPISLFPMEMFTKDHLEATRRGDIIWIPPENIRASRDSRAIAATLNELHLAQGTIGVVGLEVYPPWHPEGIVPYRLWNNILDASAIRSRRAGRRMVCVSASVRFRRGGSQRRDVAESAFPDVATETAEPPAPVNDGGARSAGWRRRLVPWGETPSV